MPKELGEHALVLAGRARWTFLPDAEKRFKSRKRREVSDTHFSTTSFVSRNHFSQACNNQQLPVAAFFCWNFVKYKFIPFRKSWEHTMESVMAPEPGPFYPPSALHLYSKIGQGTSGSVRTTETPSIFSHYLIYPRWIQIEPKCKLEKGFQNIENTGLNVF